MGYYVWHDDENQRAGIFCSTSEEPLPLQSFAGRDAQEQAEDFLAWLGRDPRSLPNEVLRGRQMEWWTLAFDMDDDFHPIAETVECLDG